MAFNSPVWFNVGCDKLEPNSDAQNWHWDRAASRRVEENLQNVPTAVTAIGAKDLKELRYNLVYLSLTAVQGFYELAFRRYCQAFVIKKTVDLETERVRRGPSTLRRHWRHG